MNNWLTLVFFSSSLCTFMSATWIERICNRTLHLQQACCWTSGNDTGTQSITHFIRECCGNSYLLCTVTAMWWLSVSFSSSKALSEATSIYLLNLQPPVSQSLLLQSPMFDLSSIVDRWWIMMQQDGERARLEKEPMNSDLTVHMAVTPAGDSLL